MSALTTLAAPQVIEALDYETLLAIRKADLIARDLALADVLAVESEPLTMLLEEDTYRELLLRQRINDGAEALLLAYAIGTDLDHIAYTYYNNTTRLLIQAGDPNAAPPTADEYESDDGLRVRCRLSLYGRGAAGAVGAYAFYAKTADANVKDVFVARHTPEAGDVTLYILSRQGDGTPTQAMLDALSNACSAEDVRPLNDTVFVQAASIVNWALDVQLICYPDANASLVLEQANIAADAFVAEHHALGHDITLAALAAALVVPGVQDVVHTSPAANIAIADHEAPWNTAVNIVVGGFNA